MSFWTDLSLPTQCEALVAFTDCDWLTRHAAQAGAAKVLPIMAGYFALTGRIVKEAGGRLIKTLGDGALVVFPAELADAGMLALRRVRREGAEWFAGHGYDNRVAVKADLGPVVLGLVGSPGDEIIDVFGRAVAVAHDLPGSGVIATPAVLGRLRPETIKTLEEEDAMFLGQSLRVAALAAGLATAGPVAAQTIIEDWSRVTPPPPPALSRVTVAPSTTALLVLDVATQTCNAQTRPRCVAMLPKVRQLIAFARAKGLMVVYSLGGASTAADILPEAAPAGGEPMVKSGPDKFVGTDLDRILKDKGIKTVVAIGAAAHGAVLHTASASAFRGYDVVVPVDAMAAESVYAEQYTAWHLVNAPRLADRVKLTKADMIE